MWITILIYVYKKKNYVDWHNPMSGLNAKNRTQWYSWILLEIGFYLKLAMLTGWVVSTQGSV